jgi:hypothetical protein
MKAYYAHLVRLTKAQAMDLLNVLKLDVREQLNAMGVST